MEPPLEANFELETCNYRADGLWHRFQEKLSALMWTSKYHAVVRFSFGIY